MNSPSELESDMTPLLYAPHFLPGRGGRNGHQRVRIVHAVKPMPRGRGGDHFDEALCGAKPTGKSLGWCATYLEINCPKCKKVLGI